MTKSHKEVAIDFLNLITSGRVREAFRKYATHDFRHHNPFYRGDADSLMAAMEENASKTPTLTLVVQRAVQEENLVTIFSRITRDSDDPGVAAVHIFRFQGNIITELWDIVQPVPADSPNENGMF